MKSIPYDRRRNTLSSDMAAYMRAVAPDNDEAVSRLKRNLRIARREELTARQAQVLRLYFEEEMTMEAVAMPWAFPNPRCHAPSPGPNSA